MNLSRLNNLFYEKFMAEKFLEKLENNESIGSDIFILDLGLKIRELELQIEDEIKSRR